MKKVVISEYIHPEAVRLLKEHVDLHYDPELYRRKEGLAHYLQNSEALVVRNQTVVDHELLEHAPLLKVVGRAGVGLDNLDLPALTERQIIVTWAPGTNAVSVAEYVIGVMLAFSRSFSSISDMLHTGVWDRQAGIGREIHGKTLGIVGLGDIGGRLARRAGALGLTLVASDPLIHDSSPAVQEYDVANVDFTALLQTSDFVSLHAPLVRDTHNMINAQTLKLMKPTAFLINTARGGLVNEPALAQALKEKKLAGAALDVRQNEPPGVDDLLKGFPNVILTPHIAGVTQESNRRASLHVAKDILRALDGEAPLSVVN